MPINRVGGTPTPSGTTGPTTATMGAAPVNNVAPVGAVDPTAGAGTVPSVSSTLPPGRAVINGFGGKPVPTVNVALNPRAGQAGAAEVRADADDAGWVSRGDI